MAQKFKMRNYIKIKIIQTMFYTINLIIVLLNNYGNFYFTKMVKNMP